MDHRAGGNLPVEELTGGSAPGRPTLSLRPVAAGDEPFLRALYATTRPDVVGRLGWGAAQREAFLDGQFQAQRASYEAQFPAAEHLLVCLEGGPVGRLWVERSPSGILIVDVSLLPAHRGAAIGTTLLRRLMDEADRDGVPIRLSVDRDNPRATALYRRLGFRMVAEDQMRVRMEYRPRASPAASR